MKTAVRYAILLALAGALLASASAAEPAADGPWKIYQTTKAVYPQRLSHNGVTHGEARVRVSIDANGQLLDALVIACTHLDFGDEALRTVKLWHYDPERVNGRAIGVVADIEFEFRVNGTVAIEKLFPAPDQERYSPIDPFAYKAEGLKGLDRIPTPTHVVPAVYPKEWSDRGITGAATVQFYIDETGKVRIPVVTATDNPLLGASAVAAVAQWQFEPPTLKGKPVLVHAEQLFTFHPEKKKS